MLPKISIVTISYNQKEYLTECINSVLSQNYPSLEYIVVDPGSTDGSRELIENYSSSIDKIIFEPDRGPADGLNKGFQAATGDIFFFLNSDDALLPNSLNIVSSYFLGDHNIDILVGSGYKKYKNGKTKLIKSDKWDLQAFIYGANCIFQQSTFFKAKLFSDAKGFNIDNKTCWDGELWVDMACVGGKFKTVNDIFGFFRIHENSISGSNRLREAYKEDQLRIASKVCNRMVGAREWFFKNYIYRLIRKLGQFDWLIIGWRRRDTTAN
jgi:glycosyltransferase involved in cell wall biosynthesis